ncbi:MAG: T9SS type A sorting domain-containing protein [Bacteroidota bacterium]
MKATYLIMLTMILHVSALRQANAGCSFLPVFPVVIGSCTYDTINTTYYCHTGDTLIYIYSGTGGGASYVEDYYFNGTLIGSNLDTIKISEPGVYSIEHGCIGGTTYTYNRTFVFSQVSAATDIPNTINQATAYFDRATNAIVVLLQTETIEYYDVEIFSITGQKISETKNLTSGSGYSLPVMSNGLNIIRITDRQGKALIKKVMTH